MASMCSSSKLHQCGKNARPFVARQQPRMAVRAMASQKQDAAVDRRQLLQLATLPALSLAMPAASLAAKAPKGFSAIIDAQDNYQFLYPFGWQEVAVNGADVVYKDVVEPLESVSMTITTTDKKDITEFGDIQDVTATLVREVLTAPGQEFEVIKSEAREAKGHNYYEVEFTAKTPRYTRHQLAVIAAYGGNFYTLTTGSNERRWGKMKEKLGTVVRSFNLIN